MPKKLTIMARGRKHRPSGIFFEDISGPELGFPSLAFTSVPFFLEELESKSPVDFPVRLKIQVTHVRGTQLPGDPQVSFGTCAPKPLSLVRVIGLGESLASWRVGRVSLYLDLGAITDFDVVGEAVFHKDFPVPLGAISEQAGADTLTLYHYGGLLPQPLDTFDHVRSGFFYLNGVEKETVLHLEDEINLAALGLKPPNPGVLDSCVVRFAEPCVTSLGTDLRAGALVLTLRNADGETRVYASTGFDMTGGMWVILE